MQESTTRIRPVFIWLLLGSILLSVAASFLLPEARAAKQARITITRAWEREIAAFLQQCVIESGGLTNLDNRSIAQGVFGTNSLQPDRLNSEGELLDYWKTPFQIEIAAQTNFIIRSAGPNRKFDDKDDIVFSSVSNNPAKR